MDGRVIWLTGLSGAGKTTLAKELIKHLPGALLLDGDELRETLGRNKDGFDPESRKRLALTYARLARMLARQGCTVIVATISLFHGVHDWNRQNQPGYLEVFLDIPHEIRKARDPKGLYTAEAKGQLKNMAGNDVPVEFPRNPDLVLTHEHDLVRSVQKVLAALGD